MSEVPAIIPWPDHGLRATEAPTRVALFTETHRIVADIETSSRRLVEVLRDATRAHLDLRHLNLTRIADPTGTVATSSRGVLQKSDIRLAAILSETSRTERRLYGYVAKAAVRVRVLMTGCVARQDGAALAIRRYRDGTLHDPELLRVTLP